MGDETILFHPVYRILKQTLTVMTPLRPTFFMAFDMILPISTSPLAEIVATLKQEDIMKSTEINIWSRFTDIFNFIDRLFHLPAQFLQV